MKGGGAQTSIAQLIPAVSYVSAYEHPCVQLDYHILTAENTNR